MFAQHSRIDVCWADTEMCREQHVRNRARSRTVPDPITRSDATPRRPAIAITQSASSRRPDWSPLREKSDPGAAAKTAGTISAKISALRDNRSNRFSPGLWLVPAASTTSRAPSRSANSPAPDPDRVGKRRSVQNVARLCDRQIRIAIDKQDPRTDAAHHHGIGRSTTRPVRLRRCQFFMAFLPYPMSELYPRASADGPTRTQERMRPRPQVPSG